METDKVIKKVEELLETKQINGTIQNVQEEAIFLCGAISVIHTLINKDSDRLDNIPPSWIFCPMSSRSVNDFDYQKRG